MRFCVSPHACSDVARCRSGRSLSDFVVGLPYFLPGVAPLDVGLRVVGSFHVEFVVILVGPVGFFHVGSPFGPDVERVWKRLQTSIGPPDGCVVHYVARCSSGFLHVNGVRLRLQNHHHTEYGLVVGARRIRFRRILVVGVRRIRFRRTEVGPISILASRGGCFRASRGGLVLGCTEGDKISSFSLPIIFSVSGSCFVP